MDGIILKSFAVEAFLSFAVLFLLVYNVFVVTEITNNYYMLQREAMWQTVFVLLVCTFLLVNTTICGSVSNNLFYNDMSTINVKGLITILSIFLVITIYPSFVSQKISYFEYFILFLISELSFYAMISSRDLLSFYLAIELQSLCFYVFAAFKRDSAFSAESGLKYFIFSSIMSAIFLFGASLIYATIGTLFLPYIVALLIPGSFAEYGTTFYTVFAVGAIFITSSLLFKLACAPFHFWAPDVYEGAPLISTIIISAIPKIPVFYFLFKWLSTVSVCQDSTYIQTFLLGCGILSILFGTFFALSQKRLKRLIIYSSIAQTGFMVAAASTCSIDDFTTVFLFLIVYLFTTLCLWGQMVVFYNYQSSQGKIRPAYISSFVNFYKYNSFFAVNLSILLLSTGGVPPLLGFFPKIYILIALMSNENIFMVVFLIILSTVAMYYYVRVIKLTFFEPNSSKRVEAVSAFHNSGNDNLLFIISLLIFFFLFSFFLSFDIRILIEYFLIGSMDI